MADKPTDAVPTLAEIDARLRELEVVQQLILRILSTTKPLDGVLESYGATASQEQAFYRLLDDIATRARGRDQDKPTFGYFTAQIDALLPSLRGNREFVGLVIDTLKLERPAYRELHAYMTAQGWPRWT